MIIFRAVFRCGAEIIEGVIHPSHIPFIIEAKTALIDRISYFRERSGIFGSENDGRMHSLQSLIHILEKFHCIQVDTTCRIALPVDRTADRIHADTVHMKFTDPVVGAGLQKAFCFSAGVHEIAASPFTDTDSGIWIFKKSRSVIICKPVGIYGKMYRNKIHQDTDSMSVAGINKSF